MAGFEQIVVGGLGDAAARQEEVVMRVRTTAGRFMELCSHGKHFEFIHTPAGSTSSASSFSTIGRSFRAKG